MSIRIASLFALLAACVEPPQTPDESAVGRILPPPPICPIWYPPEVHSGNLYAPETWRDHAVHFVNADLVVRAPLTVGACAQVRVYPSVEIEVVAGGALTAQSGVSFQEYGPTPWAQLRIVGGQVTMNSASLSGAGTFANSTIPAISLESGTLNIQTLKIANTTGVALSVTGGAIDPSSNGLTVNGAGASAITIRADMVDQLPSNDSIFSNAHDEILVATGGLGSVVTKSATWKNLGVPYHITGNTGSTLDVNAPSPGVAVLTIEQGATLAFDKGTGLRIDPIGGKSSAASAALVAVGVTFTSAAASPQAGDWTALFFGGAIDSRTVLDSSLVEFAGGPDLASFGSCPTPFTPNTFDNPAEIRFESGPVPPGSFITNTTFSNSAASGIDRGFTVTSTSTAVPDFTAPALNNQFVSVPFCEQTHPRVNGGCPVTPTCN